MIAVRRSAITRRGSTIKIFKVSVPTDADALPEEQVHCELSFEVIAGEKFTKLAYRGYNFL